MIWLLLMTAPAKAATPLDYTRMILQQAGTIVAGNQTHDQKLALSFLYGNFLDTDAMGRDSPLQHWSSFNSAQQRGFLSLPRTYPACLRSGLVALSES
jgi:hypothetical protein